MQLGRTYHRRKMGNDSPINKQPGTTKGNTMSSYQKDTYPAMCPYCGEDLTAEDDAICVEYPDNDLTRVVKPKVLSARGVIKLASPEVFCNYCSERLHPQRENTGQQ